MVPGGGSGDPVKLARLILVLGALSLGGSAASTSYTLRRGDTLSHVADKFKVPLVAVIAANDEIQNPDRVREGQLVKVPDPEAARVAVARPIAASTTPAANDDSKSYRVVAGDTLGAIAKRFGTTVGDLVRRNDLSGPNALIREGKDLRLPPEADVPTAEAPLCPVRGADKFSFSNSFGAPREGRRQHGGNDMFSRRGTPVVAPVDGVVRTVVGRRAGFGFYVDGVDGVTYYGAHMDSSAVSDGQRVKRGEVLGAVGNTGNAAGTPPHLHFEMKPGNGAPIDPYPLLRVWCR